MKPEDLFNAVTDLRDDQILEGETRLSKPEPAKRRHWTALAAALAVVILGAALVVPGLLRGRETPTAAVTETAAPTDETPVSTAEPEDDGGAFQSKYALAAAAYPKMAPYADENAYWKNGSFDYEAYRAALSAWTESRSALRPDTDYTEGLEAYLRAILPRLLTGGQAETEGEGEPAAENRVCSPLNVYMALAMLAESTAGESRQEVLDLLNAPSIETLRARANALWRANYSDDGRVTVLLGASLWLRDDMEYNEETVQTLAGEYYASVFAGPMGQGDYSAALRQWMNRQTGNLLEDLIGDIDLSGDTVAAVVTTVDYRAAWAKPFYTPMQQIFHSPDGDRACRFMRRADENTLYEGKGFRAAGVDLSGGGMMYFLLPDEGLTPEELLSKKEALAFLLGPTGRGNTDGGQVLLNLAVPEFDVSAETDLIFRLQELGVTAVFDPERSDFSPLTTDTDASITVSKADHGARVTLDEKGISGAAYTILEATKAGLPEELEEVELTLDRPFLFVITNEQGLPLFVGIVNQPTE